MPSLRGYYTDEKDSVLKDLATLKSSYDQAIAENTSMSDELIEARDEVAKTPTTNSAAVTLIFFIFFPLY